MERSGIFRRCALASGLVTEDQVVEAERAIAAESGASCDEPAPLNAERLGRKLIELGRLNAWQVEQLRHGRSKFNLGPYLMVDSIGQGGMGQVFKAEHTIMARTVAVKVLPRSKSTPEAVTGFNREIRAQARLDHPNLVRALDAGHDGNVHFLVTEYVDGTDLRRLVRRHGRLSMPTAAYVISQAAHGLEHAHQMGMIHRDVKPGNILVTATGKVKVSDLGLVGFFNEPAECDVAAGKIVGTADYLSPEQIIAPERVSPASDIYSLGCTMYYAVTGKVPFPGGTTRDKARAHCHMQPLDPRRLNSELTAEFVEVLGDMMAKDTKDRIQSASEVVARLAPWAADGARQWAQPATAGAGRRMTPPPLPRSNWPYDQADVSDTQPPFFVHPLTEPGTEESPSQISQATHPTSAADQETIPQLELDPIRPVLATEILWSLWERVPWRLWGRIPLWLRLVPLVLAGAGLILLIDYLVRLAR